MQGVQKCPSSLTNLCKRVPIIICAFKMYYKKVLKKFTKMLCWSMCPLFKLIIWLILELIFFILCLKVQYFQLQSRDQSYLAFDVYIVSEQIWHHLHFFIYSGLALIHYSPFLCCVNCPKTFAHPIQWIASLLCRAEDMTLAWISKCSQRWCSSIMGWWWGMEFGQRMSKTSHW